jgi:hypothetical protein
VQLGETVCKTPEEFKAWSQNLGHEQVLTTFYSYGQVAGARQGQIMRDVAKPRRSERTDVDEIAKAVVRVVGCAESIRDSKFPTGAIAAWGQLSGQQINCLSENLYFSIRYS